MIVMWKKQLEKARRWAASQEEKLSGIADGSKIPVIFNTEENGEEEEGDESDEEEETNHAEFIDLFPEDVVIEND